MYRLHQSPPPPPFFLSGSPNTVQLVLASSNALQLALVGT